MSGEKKPKVEATEATTQAPPVQAQEVPPMAAMNPAANDVFPDFAVDPAEMTRRTAMLKDYVREHMTEGEDYGIIPGGSKPTLFKPGAEKLNAVFGLSPMVDINNRVEDWDSGFVAYEVKVTLVNKRTQGVEAEGVGSCNSRERRYKNQDAANVANTILKMAKKRALVDATLSATRASGMFTQDLEDLDLDTQREFVRPQRDESNSRNSRPAPPREAAPATGSGDLLTDAQHRAILAIAGRVFGRHSREEDLDRMVNKPLDTLSKSEASSIIDQLRSMLGETPQTGGGEAEVAFTRAGSRAARNGSAS